jgi:DNA-binding GntR family transcriptional regulator
MQAHDTESLSEQIAKHISEQIIRGELVEGERIQELRIAAELDVSRGSVREALLLLERTHLIEIYPRRGASL